MNRILWMARLVVFDVNYFCRFTQIILAGSPPAPDLYYPKKKEN